MSDELIMWVDRENTVIGSVSRARMRAEGLCHRAVYVLVLNSAGEICVHRRTMRKDFRPGWLELSAGGVVAADEEWRDAAQRELEEELGVKAVLTDHGMFFDEGDDYQVWGRVYSCMWDGELRLQPEEVEDAWFMPIENISTELMGPITETSLNAFHYWQSVQRNEKM
ncbi:NUDIX hydrolase [Pokkaliibacter plantistimulans]|uniref:NUDIX hydrolase n=1 Tax=Proteobacteria bacterium 228 TaxID=2083153 RepID=A0A2S5KV42_9PROT|nr:NUDIX hydrolase YfcD [Pokkaliibacter plantistimulans]PPC78588.1 NUDIX hydrolase [Pokkaliibacter plantistimulans]